MFKGVIVLKDVSWEVKKGEWVGFVGVNGVGKIMQFRIIVGEEELDEGEVIKVRENMKIVFLMQEFDVVVICILKEEFLNVFVE